MWSLCGPSRANPRPLWPRTERASTKMLRTGRPRGPFGGTLPKVVEKAAAQGQCPALTREHRTAIWPPWGKCPVVTAALVPPSLPHSPACRLYVRRPPSRCRASNHFAPRESKLDMSSELCLDGGTTRRWPHGGRSGPTHAVTFRPSSKLWPTALPTRALLVFLHVELSMSFGLERPIGIADFARRRVAAFRASLASTDRLTGYDTVVPSGARRVGDRTASELPCLAAASGLMRDVPSHDAW